jgi:hypothetical protein
MQAQEMNPRTLELVIIKAFDELTIEEGEELAELISQDGSNKEFIESLMRDREKLMDFISLYTKSNVECDNMKIEKAKIEFDKGIARMKGN